MGCGRRGRRTRMSTAGWRYLAGGLFAAGFIVTLLGILRSWGNAPALTGAAVVTAGGLLLVAALPQVSEFAIGLKGVSAKLTQVERQVDEQQQVINALVHYSMS